MIFFADNLILLEDQELKVFSTYLYLIAIGILFNYVVTDSQLFRKNQFLKDNFKIKGSHELIHLELKELLSEGLITEVEYDSKRSVILNTL